MQTHQKPTVKSQTIILLSGGIDSAATLVAYRSKGNDVEAVFIDYGQPARRSEWAVAQLIAQHYSVPISKIKLGLRLPVKKGEFFGRNALFVLLAGAVSTSRPLVIAMGIHAASPYYDSTTAFAEDMRRVLDGYTGGVISLGVPFLEMTKADVVKFARRHRIPLELTYSCERKNAPACGKCPSCEDRKLCHVD